jgi:hypothetical protein
MPPQFAPPPSAAERAAPLRVRIRKATPADIPTILGFVRRRCRRHAALTH